MIAGADSLDFRDIHALDARTAWALSSGDADKGQARIYRTTDGGTSWTMQYKTEQKGVFLDALAFWDATHGIAMSDPVDGKLFLLTTTDAGATWARVPPERLPAVLPREAAFAASGTCLTTFGATHVWIGTGGGTRARVFHSADRGRTWSVTETPMHADSVSGIFSLAFRDAAHGVAVGGSYTQPHGTSDNALVTSDGGRTWRFAKGQRPGGYMSGVAYVTGTPRTFVAVGLGGTAVSSDGGENWRMVDTLAYNSVTFGGRGAGYAAGPRGRVARWVGPGASAKPPR